MPQRNRRTTNSLPASAARLVVSPEWAAASDDACIRSLIAYAHGGHVSIRVGEKVLQADGRRDHRRLERLKALELALTDREGALGAYFARPANRRRLTSQPVLVKAGRGHALKWQPDLTTTEEVFDYAEGVLLDDARPFGANLARCRHPECRRFYLVEHQRREGGRPNTDYCSPKCRKDAHNRKLTRGKQ